MRGLKLAKKKTLTWWKKKAWEQFSEFIRLRDAILTTGTDLELKCISCTKTYPAFGKGCAQAGHFVAGRSHALLFSETGVFGQCYNCNINLKGNWVDYEAQLLIRFGAEYTEACKSQKYKLIKYRDFDFEEMRDYYKMLLETMRDLYARGNIDYLQHMLKVRHNRLDDNGRPESIYDYQEIEYSGS